MKRNTLVRTTIRQALCPIMVTLLLVLLVGIIPARAATIVINEILADPAADLAGDANGDGVRGTYDDEFVEIVNSSAGSIDLSGRYRNT